MWKQLFLTWFSCIKDTLHCVYCCIALLLFRENNYFIHTPDVSRHTVLAASEREMSLVLYCWHSSFLIILYLYLYFVLLAFFLSYNFVFVLVINIIILYFVYFGPGNLSYHFVCWEPWLSVTKWKIRGLGGGSTVILDLCTTVILDLCTTVILDLIQGICSSVELYFHIYLHVIQVSGDVIHVSEDKIQVSDDVTPVSHLQLS